MIVQERLTRNYDAVRKFQKSVWGYLRMGEYTLDDSLFYFGSRKTPVNYNDLHIFFLFLA